MTSPDPPTPDPLTERPPYDRYCDLVMTGGVASGVVYPWAILELARHYRFRNIGGTSVGAVAAAITAASEYGRCMGVPYPFEVIRRIPGELAGAPSSSQAKTQTMMLSLFQTKPEGRRLFALLCDVLEWYSYGRLAAVEGVPTRIEDDQDIAESKTPSSKVMRFLLRKTLCLYAPQGLRSAWPLLAGAVITALLAAVLGPGSSAWAAGGSIAAAVFIALFAWAFVQGVSAALQQDFVDGVMANHFGLCSGLSMGQGRGPAFTDWMHDGIQKAAGLGAADPPLTFRQLWRAPRLPGEPADPEADYSQIDQRAIHLEVLVSNVTHGRPYRFPLADDSVRLYWRRCEWDSLFPVSVLDWLEKNSAPYAARSRADPLGSNVAGLRELPYEDLPLVVAARMSMAFPLIFSTVPVYAVDREDKEVEDRLLRPCRLADGGLCSNFPIHLFDAALPPWPTFGLWLTQRHPSWKEQPLWRPSDHLQGRADNWQRFERATMTAGADATGPHTVGTFVGFLWNMVLTMKNWPNKLQMTLPGVRDRVVRLALWRYESELNIAMPSAVILRAAHRYGTGAARELVEAFVPGATNGRPQPAWQQHLFIRYQTLLRGLRDLLAGLSEASRSSAHTQRLTELLQEAAQLSPILGRLDDDAAQLLRPEQVADLIDGAQALMALEQQLQEAMQGSTYLPVPTPEMRLRAPT